jgi:hypothetical protein
MPAPNMKLKKLGEAPGTQLEHHVCTGFGVSGKSYFSALEKLIYGIGQGSCSSPILLALLNQQIITALGGLLHQSHFNRWIK